MSAHIGNIAHPYHHVVSGRDFAPELGEETSKALFSLDGSAGIRFGRWRGLEEESLTFVASSGRPRCRPVQGRHDALSATASALLVGGSSSVESHRVEDVSRDWPAAKACDAALSTFVSSRPSLVSACLLTTALRTAQVKRNAVCAANPACLEPAAENSNYTAEDPRNWGRSSVRSS